MGDQQLNPDWMREHFLWMNDLQKQFQPMLKAIEQAQQFKIPDQFLQGIEAAMIPLQIQSATLADLVVRSQGLVEPLASLGTASLMQAGQQLADTAKVLESLAGFRLAIDDQVFQAFSRLDMRWLTQVAELAERLQKEKRVEDAFSVADLIPSPSMDADLIRQVIEDREAGATGEQIAELVAGYYEADGGARLHALVDHLCYSEEFVGREEVLRHTLQAHLTGLDSITTFPLVAMIEGLMIPILVKLEGKTVKHNKIADILKEIPVATAYEVGIEGYSCLVGFFEARLYHSSSWSDDPATRSNYVDLNRHRLLHGMASRGTRMNTIRCFLALDLLAELLPALRRLIEDE